MRISWIVSEFGRCKHVRDISLVCYSILSICWRHLMTTVLLGIMVITPGRFLDHLLPILSLR